MPIPAQVTPRDVNTFPVQLSKVQRPVLRDETLARDRLLDWLSTKIHHRLVLVTAEAGYGKTTLLADFSRRTRLRVLWYRLDESDRDWITVLNTLVAAGRAVDPTFALATASLLAEVSSGSMASGSMSGVLETFVRDLQAFGDKGGVLILDDYHVVEDVPDVQRIMREIVVRAPERLTIVILSRRAPHLPIARLRALGEVAELTRDDLRFDADETERLFRETYGRPLEADVLVELGRHTEGWAASLQLVQSALRERTMSETRTFVRGLSGAQGTLHDYLAEEVVGDLSSELQSFLMRTSILTSISPAAASIVAGDSVEEAEAHLEAAERLGLLPRVDRTSGAYRYHNLVREFLEDRLRREIGADGIAALHRRMAAFGETMDWKLAAHHYAAAGDIEELRRVLVGSIQDIMGGGGFALAEFYVTRHPELEPDPSFGLFLSRRDMYRGDFDRALKRAGAVLRLIDSDRQASDLAHANLLSVKAMSGAMDDAVVGAEELIGRGPELGIELIARGIIAIARESVRGSFDEASDVLEAALNHQVSLGQLHYQGISHLNLAITDMHRGRARSALSHADEALRLLSSSSDGTEILSVHTLRAWALFHDGREREGREAMGQALRMHGPELAIALMECAELEKFYGDPSAAMSLIDQAADQDRNDDAEAFRQLLLADLMVAEGRIEEARALADKIDPLRTRPIPVFLGRHQLLLARIGLLGSSDIEAAIASAHSVLRTQRAGFWLPCVAMLEAVTAPSAPEFNALVLRALTAGPIFATVCADDIARRLGDLEATPAEIIIDQARHWPARWRPILRRVLGSADRRSIALAARILDEIGAPDDIPRLRHVARVLRTPATAGLGRGLARRLAPKAFVRDLGHMDIQVGDRLVDGSTVRRRVLGLVCYLLTKPGYAATRDQVLEALWPEQEPAVAVNSLNQTVYFLRRVFEEGYREDESANYVHHDGEVVRLDTELVDSTSARCRRMIELAADGESPALVGALSVEYAGRFAMDFEYEDWASPFRETLHAAYLAVVERAIQLEVEAAEFTRGAALARRALEVDPDADALEEGLIRIYQRLGLHAAASEQHAHYSAAAGDEGARLPDRAV